MSTQAAARGCCCPGGARLDRRPAMAKTVEKGKKKSLWATRRQKTLRHRSGCHRFPGRPTALIELAWRSTATIPHISIDAAWNLPSQVHHCVNLNDMLSLCAIGIPSMFPTCSPPRCAINAQTPAPVQGRREDLNHACGELVNTAAPCWRPWRRARFPRLHDRLPHSRPFQGASSASPAPRIWCFPRRVPRTTAAMAAGDQRLPQERQHHPLGRTCPREVHRPVQAASASASSTRTSPVRHQPHHRLTAHRSGLNIIENMVNKSKRTWLLHHAGRDRCRGRQAG